MHSSRGQVGSYNQGDALHIHMAHAAWPNIVKREHHQPAKRSTHPNPRIDINVSTLSSQTPPPFPSILPQFLVCGGDGRSGGVEWRLRQFGLHFAHSAAVWNGYGAENETERESEIEVVWMMVWSRRVHSSRCQATHTFRDTILIVMETVVISVRSNCWISQPNLLVRWG